MADPTPTPTVTPTVTPSHTPSVTPTVTPSASTVTLQSLINAYPEIANSLTLNPAGSAEMLDPYIRSREAIYTDRARLGEFGYNVHRRLRNQGYNI